MFEIALTAVTFVGGQIGVATSFGVGAAEVGVTVSNSLSITNDGEATLNVDLTFADGSPFSSTVATLTVEPGASGTIPIDLVPGAEGATTGLLTLATNDVLNPSVDVTLVGFGGVPPEGSVTIDFAVAANDQGQRIVGNAVSGETIELQLNIAGAPEFLSWRAKLVYDSAAAEYVTNSFETHKLTAGMTPQVTSGAGTVTVGGTFVDEEGASTSKSGRVSLGNMLFDLQDTFTDETDVAVTLVTLDLVDGTQLALIMNSIGTITDDVVTVSLNGDFDNSGRVDFLDLFLFADAFGGVGPIYDLDQNGIIDLEDFFLFADNFGARVQAKLLAKARELFGIPLFSELYQNFPNPFNSETTIRYQIREEAVVYLDIWDVTGQKVRTLRQEMQQPGQYEVVWDGTDDDGRRVASGVYFTRIEAAKFMTVNKMLFVK